jgi:hypothetical protein
VPTTGNGPVCEERLATEERVTCEICGGTTGALAEPVISRTPKTRTSTMSIPPPTEYWSGKERTYRIIFIRIFIYTIYIIYDNR